MNELLEYCKSTVKCGWLLTKDFLLIEHNCLTGKLLELTAPLISYMNVMPYGEGVLFSFNMIGVCSNKARLMHLVKSQLEAMPDYVLGKGTAMGSFSKKSNYEVIIPDNFQIPFGNDNNGKVVETTA